MARPKNPPDPILMTTHTRLLALMPGLRVAGLRIRQLDGPPAAPRFAVDASMCPTASGCDRQALDGGQCSAIDCPQRRMMRLLLSREGQILQVIHHPLP